MSASKKIPLSDLMKEHKHLVKVLRKGGKSARGKEASKQAKEMRGYRK
jgi:hypothetical protein